MVPLKIYMRLEEEVLRVTAEKQEGSQDRIGLQNPMGRGFQKELRLLMLSNPTALKSKEMKTKKVMLTGYQELIIISKKASSKK